MSNTMNGTQRGRSNRRNKSNGQGKAPMYPPQFSTNVVVRRTYRFSSAAAGATSITGKALCGIIGGVCTVANTTLSMIAKAAKLHKVTIWAPPPSQGATAFISVLWTGSTFVSNNEITDSTMSVSRPARIVARPPPGCDAAFWVASSVATGLFTLNVPVGGIIDVDVSHTLADDLTAGTTYAVAAGTLGALYYIHLDGTAHTYPPVGLGSTT